MKWNSPFYGIEGQGWFVTFHVLTRYVKVNVFKGAEIDPLPPGATPKSGEARWTDLYEGEFDEARLANWMKQAAGLAGWKPLAPELTGLLAKGYCLCRSLAYPSFA